MYRKTNGGSETRLLRLTLVYYLVSRDERNPGKIRRDLEHGLYAKSWIRSIRSGTIRRWWFDGLRLRISIG
jgi:hypothetical protein